MSDPKKLLNEEIVKYEKLNDKTIIALDDDVEEVLSILREVLEDDDYDRITYDLTYRDTVEEYWRGNDGWTGDVKDFDCDWYVGNGYNGYENVTYADLIKMLEEAKQAL